MVSIANGLREALGADRVSVVDGVEVRRDPLTAGGGSLRDPETGEFGMRVTTRDGDGEVIESRHVGRTEVFTRESPWLRSAASIELTAEDGDAPLGRDTFDALEALGTGNSDALVHRTIGCWTGCSSSGCCTRSGCP